MKLKIFSVPNRLKGEQLMSSQNCIVCMQMPTPELTRGPKRWEE